MTKALPPTIRNREANLNYLPGVESAPSAAAGISLTFCQKDVPLDAMPAKLILLLTTVIALAACKQDQIAGQEAASQNSAEVESPGLYNILPFPDSAYRPVGDYSPYTEARVGILSPQDYLKRARSFARNTYSIYDDQKFEHATILILDAPPDAQDRPLIRVSLTRYDGTGSFSKIHNWTTIDMTLSRDGKVVASMVESDEPRDLHPDQFDTSDAKGNVDLWRKEVDGQGANAHQPDPNVVLGRPHPSWWFSTHTLPSLLYEAR